MTGRMLATFRWLGNLPADEEVGADPATRYSGDFGEQWHYQATLPVANSIREAFRQLGYPTNSQPPYFAENGWYFGVEVNQTWYDVVVEWIAKPGSQRNDYFAAQAFQRSGLISQLFRQRSRFQLRVILEQLLTSHPLVCDFEFIDEKSI
jgi:hypothetical protein